MYFSQLTHTYTHIYSAHSVDERVRSLQPHAYGNMSTNKLGVQLKSPTNESTIYDIIVFYMDIYSNEITAFDQLLNDFCT